MRATTCTECKKEINYDATICPWCHTRWGGRTIGDVNAEHFMASMVTFARSVPVFFKYVKWGLTTKKGFLYLGLPFIVSVIVMEQNFLIGMLILIATVGYGALKSKWPDFSNPNSEEETVDRSKSKDS